MTWLVDLFKKWRGVKPVYRCGRCGRPLIDKDSIARGFGPDCWKIVQPKREIPKGLLRFEPADGTGGVVVDSQADPLEETVAGYKMDPETGEITKLEEEKKEEGKNEQTD